MPITINQEIHREYLKSPLWRAKRIEALTFYGSKCSRCGNEGGDVHHKTYARTGGNELIQDLEIICRPCHESHHRAERMSRLGIYNRKRRPITTRAMFSSLNKSQKITLMGKHGIDTEARLYILVAVEPNHEVISTAKAMLGVGCCYKHIGKKKQKRYGCIN